MSYDADKLIKLGNELLDAKLRVQEIEAQINALVTGGKVPLSNLAHPQGRRSTPDKVTALLNAEPDKTFSFSEIFGAIGGNEAYMRSLVARMIKEKKIESRGWGRYGAIREDSFGTIKEKLRATS
jgi:hypothetical protein